jgi:hypothetical protein
MLQQLTWSGVRDGALGSGEELAITSLSPGAHTISLAATDSDNNTAAFQVQVFVGYEVQLPLLWK